MGHQHAENCDAFMVKQIKTILFMCLRFKVQVLHFCNQKYDFLAHRAAYIALYHVLSTIGHGDTRRVCFICKQITHKHIQNLFHVQAFL